MSHQTHLPATRLVTTGHSASGKSIFTFDGLCPPFMPFGPTGNQFTSIHTSAAVPVSNTAPFPDLARAFPVCPPGGVLFVTTDIPAGGDTPLHRTLTIDYAVVLSGEIVLALEGGVEKTVTAGEVIVQRGANHAWYNRSTASCRILSVMVAAKAITLADGTVLETTRLGPKP